MLHEVQVSSLTSNHLERVHAFADPLLNETESVIRLIETEFSAENTW
jgi:hypothetical protein